MPVGRDRLSAGRVVDISSFTEIPDVVRGAGFDGYDFVALNLCLPRSCLSIKDILSKAEQLTGGSVDRLSGQMIRELLPPITTPDLILSGNEWSRLVVGRISDWIDPDSDNVYIKAISEKALFEEFQHFAYLSLPAVVIPLRSGKLGNLARIIMQILSTPGQSNFAIWLDVPAVAPHNVGVDGDQQDDSDDTWRWFYDFRTACNNDKRIALLLELTADLPQEQLDIARWKGEPLRAVKLNTKTFLTNNHGYPALSKAHQALAKDLFALNVQVLLDGESTYQKNHVDADLPSEIDQPEEPDKCVYFAYLNHLWKGRRIWPYLQLKAKGFQDTLYQPMHPLIDTLTGLTYEVFETDYRKYSRYKRAVDAALCNFVWRHESTADTVIVMVLGAGRGPLVTASYEALKRLNVPFKLYAVEKNPCAMATLNYKRDNEWNGEVEVVFSDMRNFKPAEKADIIVSELLGSFGDNELSPECLDGALHLMKDDCISIPTSYESYIGPVHSPKLFNEVKIISERERNPQVAYESAYVVRVHNHFEIAAPKPLFKFTHPNKFLSSNDRFEELSFTAVQTSDMVGFVGYFDSLLYDDVRMSIVPSKHTTNLCSWFPLFFPLQNPVFVQKGQTIRLRFWRCSNERQIWYEWQIVEPVLTPILNVNGRSYAIRLV